MFHSAQFLLMLIAVCQSSSSFKWQRRGAGEASPTSPEYRPIPAQITSVKGYPFCLANTWHRRVYDKEFECTLFNQWKLISPPEIIHGFINGVMLHQISLASNLLIGPVLDAIAADPIPANIAKAASIWSYLHLSIHEIKPNQVLYSKMLKIYFNPFGRSTNNIEYHHGDRQRCLAEAAKVVDEWAHEYQVDKQSLQVCCPSISMSHIIERFG